MAFNLFKKKEVIESSNENKPNNDIVEDFGAFIKNDNNTGNDLTLSSFESNFKEQINDTIESLQQTNSIDTLSNISDNFSYSFNESVNSNVYSNNNFNTTEDKNTVFNSSYISDEETNLSNNNQLNSNQNNNFNFIKNDQSSTEGYSSLTNTEMNSGQIQNEFKQTQTTNLLNINNYDYNPIMDNLESIPDNLKNSQDINEVLSNLYKPAQSKEIEIQDTNQSIQKETTMQTQTVKVDTTEVDPGYKRCPKCGQKMREDYKQCFVCGTMF